MIEIKEIPFCPAARVSNANILVLGLYIAGNPVLFTIQYLQYITTFIQPKDLKQC